MYLVPPLLRRPDTSCRGDLRSPPSFGGGLNTCAARIGGGLYLDGPWGHLNTAATNPNSPQLVGCLWQPQVGGEFSPLFRPKVGGKATSGVLPPTGGPPCGGLGRPGGLLIAAPPCGSAISARPGCPPPAVRPLGRKNRRRRYCLAALR